MQVDVKEALRYLGVRGEPDEATRQLLEDCIAQLMPAAVFRHVALEVSVQVQGDDISLAGLTVHSHALARHFEGCGSALLFAATLGAGVDRLMQAAAASNLPVAAALQACAASLLEDASDEAQAAYACDYAAKGLYLKPRFSPGYGDFDLTHQPDMLRMLDAQKRIGLFCTKNNMLTPTKSITAVIGITDQPTKRVSGCAACGKDDCAFKKE